MIRGMKLSTKMIFITSIAFMSLSILYGTVYFNTKLVNRNMSIQDLRNKQLHTIREMQKARLDLLLAAMDSIIDRDEGSIASDRMEIINESSAIILDNMSGLLDLADTNEEERLAKEISTEAGLLIKSIKGDLVQLIDSSGKESSQIENDFDQIDDILDECGDSVSEKLNVLESSLTEIYSKEKDSIIAYNSIMDVSTSLLQVQQYLTDVAATHSKDGFGEAEKYAQKFREGLDAISKLSKNDEMVEETKSAFEIFYDTGREMANQYIENGVDAGNKLMAEFDKYANDIHSRFTSLSTSLQKEAAKAQAVIDELQVVNKMQLAKAELILAAMDSIIDKNDGSVSPERMEIINSRILLLQQNIGEISKLTFSEQEKAMIKEIEVGVSQLDNGVRVELVNLIGNSAKRLQQIESDFAKIDDLLDKYSEKVAMDLSKIELSVSAELAEANENMMAALSGTSVFSFVTYVVCALVLLVACIAVARSVIGPITQIVAEIASSSDQVSIASDQVSEASQELAQGAAEQAAGVEESSSSLEEMASMTKQNSANALEASKIASHTSELANSGSDAMTKMNSAILDIQTSTDETAKIIKAIDEIAFQTNLLALNAAVEAARAGESGKGFAVVAEEVRNLAMRSAEAAKNTSSLIETSVKNSNHGVQISSEVNTILSEIIQGINKTRDLVNEISSASQEQANGIEQVSVSVNSMDKITQSNAANAEESAGAAASLQKQAKQMINIIGELSSMVSSSSSYGRKTAYSENKMELSVSDEPFHQIANSSVRKQSTDIPAEKAIPFDDANDFSSF